jgi:hypothetical protein
MNRPPSIPQHIWDSLTDEARTVIGAALAELEERLAEAEQQIQELRARLDQNSTNLGCIVKRPTSPPERSSALPAVFLDPTARIAPRDSMGP